MAYKIYSKNILTNSYEWDENIFATKKEAADYAVKAKMQSVFLIPAEEAWDMMKQQRNDINRQVRQQQSAPMQYVDTVLDQRPREEEVSDEEKARWPWIPRSKFGFPEKSPIAKPAMVKPKFVGGRKK